MNPILVAAICYVLVGYVRYFILLGMGRICQCNDYSCVKDFRWGRPCPETNDAFKYCMKIWDWRAFFHRG